jgi:hypothetical protein
LVVFHPVTTKFGQEKKETEELLAALHELQMPTVWLWPNIDAGGNNVSKVLRRYREHNPAQWLRLVVGNSSSFLRDSSFLGTPVVLVGDRQAGREIAQNVIRVAPQKQDILSHVRQQLEHGPYPSSFLYGQGNAGPQIAKALTHIEPYVQKQLQYTREEICSTLAL